ncbi:hypothetical protein RU97_GL000023 [Enterococcus canis]|uniref:Uncharacterized protein n=1 Tax=Enterococcus canis TaxID=214095 RepID=A0A1L8RJ41_9ENTE|nr:hypothetical protein RU97_GL000023 [Enterococcus canis]
MEFHDKMEKRFFQFLVVFGIGTLLVNIVRIFTSEPSSQYQLLTLEMVAGILIIFLPMLFTKVTGLVFPKMVRLYYWFFLWISVFLGTGLRMILIVPFWDKILHAVSPMLLVAVGYALIGFYLKKIDQTQVSPWLYIIFGFAFAGVCGVFWEFWEFTCDQFFNMNLQRYMTEAGQPYIGRAALMDTMGDLLTNTLGALILTVYSFIKRKDPNYFPQYAFKEKA